MLVSILVVMAVIAIFAVAISRQPGEFAISRSSTMVAAPDVIFAHVYNLHQWDAWSPWAKMDLNAVNSFAGPEAGVGATMSWTGNAKVGTGRMTIIESVPHDLVRLRLEFLKPMKAVNIAEFVFGPHTDGTASVTWTMTGRNNFMGKTVGLVINCEKIVGGQFEKGLSNLKNVVETRPH